MPEDTVTINREEYEELLREQRLLNALRNGGVESWDWYGASIEDHYPEYFEED